MGPGKQSKWITKYFHLLILCPTSSWWANRAHDELFAGNSDIQWCFSQVKGTLDDDVTEADIISCVEFNQDGELLATGDKGGRVVIFQVKQQK